MRLGIEDSMRRFHLAVDPNELVEVEGEDGNFYSVLRSRLEAHEATQNALRPRAVRAGSGTRELLRATGYAGDER